MNSGKTESCVFPKDLGNTAMPRTSTFPTLFDECKIISVSQLNQWKYIEQGANKSGVITWSRHGEKIGSIGFTINYSSLPYLELDYNANGESKNYRVELAFTSSNLGKGKIWYFICPYTNCKLKTLKNLAEALGCSVADLVKVK